jgi:glyoxylase-like metal-dependent hydrolase (beta-lactamase superfamily II)
MKIIENLHVLKIPFKIHISPEIALDRFVNCYIIEGKQITLIDTGVAGSEKILFDYLLKIGRKPEEISLVLLTHSHPDHIGSVKTIKDITKCKVTIHEAERQWLEDTDLQFRERPVPGFQNLVAGPCKADKLLKDEDILEIDDNITIDVVHCPGHSVGSVSFLYRQRNVLFSGDAIPVKNDIPIYDDYLTSIKTLEKIENLPYSEYLLSSWDSEKKGDEVEMAVSDGFEVLYLVHKAWLEANKESKENDINILTKLVLEKLGMPSGFVNPLFLRALKSHKIN